MPVCELACLCACVHLMTKCEGYLLVSGCLRTYMTLAPVISPCEELDRLSWLSSIRSEAATVGILPAIRTICSSSATLNANVV